MDDETIERPRSHRLLRAGVIGAVAVSGLIGAVGTVFGHWTAPAAGEGSGEVGRLEVVVDTVTFEQPSSVLLPGALADLVVKISNAGEGALRLQDLSVGDPSVDHDGCPPDMISTTASRANPAVAALLDDLPAIPAGSTTVLRIPNVVALAPHAPHACQGATFTFPVSAEAVS